MQSSQPHKNRPSQKHKRQSTVTAADHWRLAELAPDRHGRAMYHNEDIETALKYYIRQNSQATAAVLWAAHQLLPKTTDFAAARK